MKESLIILGSAGRGGKYFQLHEDEKSEIARWGWDFILSYLYSLTEKEIEYLLLVKNVTDEEENLLFKVIWTILFDYKISKENLEIIPMSFGKNLHGVSKRVIAVWYKYSEKQIDLKNKEKIVKLSKDYDIEISDFGFEDKNGFGGIGFLLTQNNIKKLIDKNHE